MLDRFFQIRSKGSSVRREIMAGLTTFLTMAYILAVNPAILSVAGMDRGALFTATAISAALATAIMALVAKLPFALAPGMGLNAFFVYTVCLGMGHSWQFALTAVFIEGLIFILLTVLRVREAIFNAIPLNIKHAISVGIGLLIAFIGLQNAGVIVANPATLVSLGNIGDVSNNPAPLLALGTMLLTGVLLSLNVRAALLLGILIATCVGIPLGITLLPTEFQILPPSIEPIFFKLTWSEILSLDMLIVVTTLLFMDLFDTIGTLIGVSSKAGMLDAEGRVPRVRQALLADAIGTTAGALLGTSTVTTFVESASGVAAGGRTGLTALTTSVLFLLALFLSPVFLMIPEAATAAALVVVGAMMMTPIREIRMDDYTDIIPVFLTLIMMPLSFSIAEGIAFGMLSYVLLKLFSGKHSELNPIMYGLAALFLAKFWF